MCVIDKQIVTATQTTRVLIENREAFLKWCDLAARLTHREPGHLYSTLIEYPDHKEPERVIDFFVVYGFDCFRNLQRWHQSQTKLDLMLERQQWALPDDEKEHDNDNDADALSLSALEDGNGLETSAFGSGWATFVSRRDDRQLTRRGALMIPKWKMALVVMWAVWIVVTCFSIPGSVNP